MASVSASHLILFIASMLIAASVAGVFTSEVTRVAGAIDDQGLQASQEIRTDIEIITDGGSEVYAGENITLHVKNTGSRTLAVDPGIVDVFVDGSYETDVALTVLDGDAWLSGNVVRMNVTRPNLPAGDHRVKVIVGEDEEVFEFHT